MLHYIEIRPESLPLISALNNGVTPQIENEPTFFVFDSNVNGVPSDIINLTEFEKISGPLDHANIIPVVTF